MSERKSWILPVSRFLLVVVVSFACGFIFKGFYISNFTNNKNNSEEQTKTLYKKVSDLPLPEDENFSYEAGYITGDEWWLLIVPWNADKEIKLVKVHKDIFSDDDYYNLLYRKSLDSQGTPFSVYDRMLGYVHRGKILKKHGENWPEYIDVRFLDIQLDDGSIKRISVQFNLFNVVSVGNVLMPDQILEIPFLTKEEAVRRKGWLVFLYTAMADIFKFVPLDSKESPFLCSVGDQMRTGFYGDLKEPCIRDGFGPIPKGIITAMLVSDKWYTLADHFISLEQNGTAIRYRVDRSLYRKLTVGDRLP